MSTRIRIGVYGRTSTDMQRESASIQTQLLGLRRRLEADLEREIVATYLDDGVSGSIPVRYRPGGAEMLAAAQRGEFEELWVYRFDRLGRDDTDPIVVRKNLARMNVKVRALHGDTESNMVFAILNAVAAEERETLRLRTTDGMNRVAREGRYCGDIVPYGFRVEVGRLVPSEEPATEFMTEADVIRHIYKRLALNDMTCPKIAEELNALGVPTAYQREGPGMRKKRTRGLWRPGRIRNMVVNPVYKGTQVFGKRSGSGKRELIEIAVEPIVSAELWQAAQDALAKNRWSSKHERRVYPLGGMMKCGLCGLTYVGTSGKSGPFYRCNSAAGSRGRHEQRCPGRSVKGDIIESIVFADAYVFLTDPGELLDELMAEMRNDSASEGERGELAALFKREASLTAELEKVADLYRMGVYDQQRVQAESASVRKMLESVRERIAAEESQVNSTRGDVPQVTDEVLAMVRSRLDDLTPQEWKDVLAQLVRRIVVHTDVHDDGKKDLRIEIEYAFPQQGRSTRTAVSTRTGTPASFNRGGVLHLKRELVLR